MTDGECELARGAGKDQGWRRSREYHVRIDPCGFGRPGVSNMTTSSCPIAHLQASRALSVVALFSRYAYHDASTNCDAPLAHRPVHFRECHFPLHCLFVKHRYLICDYSRYVGSQVSTEDGWLMGSTRLTSRLSPTSVHHVEYSPPGRRLGRGNRTRWCHDTQPGPVRGTVEYRSELPRLGSAICAPVQRCHAVNPQADQGRPDRPRLGPRISISRPVDGHQDQQVDI